MGPYPLLWKIGSRSQSSYIEWWAWGWKKDLGFSPIFGCSRESHESRRNQAHERASRQKWKIANRQPPLNSQFHRKPHLSNHMFSIPCLLVNLSWRVTWLPMISIFQTRISARDESWNSPVRVCCGLVPCIISVSDPSEPMRASHSRENKVRSGSACSTLAEKTSNWWVCSKSEKSPRRKLVDQNSRDRGDRMATSMTTPRHVARSRTTQAIAISTSKSVTGMT